jgi:class 3 adenylate cyclase
VTVLFARIAGFAPVTARLDPEEVRDTLAMLWSALDQAIGRQGGTIDKHVSQEVLALWHTTEAGAGPVAAVRAALTMQQALVGFKAHPPAHFALTLPELAGLELRIGIHTGPAVVGAVGIMGEQTVLGDTVNLASRLEQAALPGQILISHESRTRLPAAFTVQPLAPLSVKGKAEPVQVYLVAGEGAALPEGGSAQP